MFARLATPLFPIMDNTYLDIHYFWCPMRLTWDNSRKFFGEQHDPGDSIDFTIPTMAATTTTGEGELSLWDYFGLPTKVPDYTVSALPFRMYCLVYNFWYRDQNLIDSIDISTADGAPDVTTPRALYKRGKRFDYFTSCLASPQKSTSGAQSIPLGTTAPVYQTGEFSTNFADVSTDASGNIFSGQVGVQVAGRRHWADLSNATAATILQLIVTGKHIT